jgi:hypothetical protein
MDGILLSLERRQVTNSFDGSPRRSLKNAPAIFLCIFVLLFACNVSTCDGDSCSLNFLLPGLLQFVDTFKACWTLHSVIGYFW